MAFRDELKEVQITKEEAENNQQLARKRWAEEEKEKILNEVRQEAQRGKYYLVKSWDIYDLRMWGGDYLCYYLNSELRKSEYGFYNVEIKKVSGTDTRLRLVLSWSEQGQKDYQKESPYTKEHDFSVSRVVQGTGVGCCAVIFVGALFFVLMIIVALCIA